MGSALSMFISPRLFTASASLAFAFWCGVFILGVAVLFIAGAILLDQRVEQRAHYAPLKETKRKAQFSDLKHLSMKFWLVMFTLLSFYISYICLLNVSVGYLIDMFNFRNESEAGQLPVYRV